MTITKFSLPKRLLDIGIPGSRTPFLFETATLEDKNCRYATLSHRWGDAKNMLQTFNSNITEHYQGFAWSALPKTFRDAIIVSQDLGLRYLWIDSLCIIQQNRVDFETECSTMHLIYLHCYCMIAAADSQDTSEGFLRLGEEARTMSVNDQSSRSADIWDKPAFVPQSTAFRYVHSQYVDWAEWTKVLEGGLSTRGWAFQERELAPRILHYTKSGVMWECRLCIGAGDLEKLQLRRLSGYNSRFDKSGQRRLMQEEAFRALDIDKDRLTVNDIMKRWLFVAEEYSRRILTYSEDTLPGLSGLAAAVHFLKSGEHKFGSSTYLAGVWTSHIERQLFWCPVAPIPRISKCTAGQLERTRFLPSWSWASCETEVTFYLSHLPKRGLSAELDSNVRKPQSDDATYVPYYELQRHFRFVYVSTDIKPEGIDPFGRVRGGELCIKGAYWDEDVSEAILPWNICDRQIHKYRKSGAHLEAIFDYDPPSLDGLVLRFLILLHDQNDLAGIILQTCISGKFGRIGVFLVDSRIMENGNMMNGDMILI